VKQLKEEGLGEDVNIHIYNLPVEYSTVKRQVPQIWDNHKPEVIMIV
jgi:pyroglutamyl-peptidase